MPPNETAFDRPECVFLLQLLYSGTIAAQQLPKSRRSGGGLESAKEPYKLRILCEFDSDLAGPLVSRF
jgi:hypothetical protein